MTSGVCTSHKTTGVLAPPGRGPEHLVQGRTDAVSVDERATP